MESDKITDTTFAFRISNEDKEWLTSELDQLKEFANKGKLPNARVINKNDLLLKAIQIGFSALKDEFRKPKKKRD
jgi:hypothetical protein